MLCYWAFVSMDRVSCSCLWPAGDIQKLALTTIHTDVTWGGSYEVTYSSRAVPTSIFSSSDSQVALLLLSVVYLLGLAWNLLEEAREMVYHRRAVGSILSYFENAWNWLDLASLAMQWAGVGLW